MSNISGLSSNLIQSYENFKSYKNELTTDIICFKCCPFKWKVTEKPLQRSLNAYVSQRRR